MEERKRGRPKGPETIKFQALLSLEQKDKLDFLAKRLTGTPPVTGLIRQAVDDFLERVLTPELAKEFADQRDDPIRLVR